MATMFCFPGMFLPHIEEGIIKMPEDVENFNQEKYPHWAVFLGSHLGNVIEISEISENARTIANIPDDKIKQVTMEDLKKMGVYFSRSRQLD
jgi:hypothetical protein